MEFAGGLVLGAVFGVFADRLFVYLIEKRTYVTISPSHRMDVSKGDGFCLKITNNGLEALRPYKIALFNPHRGTLFLFEHEEKTDRLPGQTDVFIVWLDTLLRHRDHWLSRFTKSRPTHVVPGTDPVEEEIRPEEFGKWSLRLLLDGSDNHILFESNSAGVAIAELMREALQTGRIRIEGDRDVRIRIVGLSGRWRAWLEAWRERKRLRASGIDA